MENFFKDKLALVTGAGKGLGRGIAKALWSAGAVTYAISRTQADLDSLKEECPGIHTILLDISADWAKTAEAVKGIGPVDLLVNNAGVFLRASPLSVTEAEYDTLFGTNVKSVLIVSQIVAQGMVERKLGGAIVNMSSLASKFGYPGALLYCASKGALDQITRCMAVELGPHKIRVNSVNAGLVMETDLAQDFVQMFTADEIAQYVHRVPMKGVMEVQDVVNATLYLLSDKANMINGMFLGLDGGVSCT